MNKITLIVRGEVSASPTVSNYLLAFLNQGYEVHCICSSWAKKSHIEGIIIHLIGYGNSSSFSKKIIDYYKFGREVKNKLEAIKLIDKDVLWVARIDTALTLGTKVNQYNSILALHELHDSYPIWRYITKKLIKYYSVIVYNEENRAQIARVWYNLKFLPNIIPNKPYNHKYERCQEIVDSKLKKLLESIDNKKIIIYQGSLEPDRNIEPLVSASNKFKNKYQLIIMGKDQYNRVLELKKINPSLIYIPWVIPPDHLNITSHAHIGIAFYDTDCLNSIYCAPNKIWEYSGFGIPVIGQNIPGLNNTIGHYEFGQCVDINDEDSIYQAIKKIDEDYMYYSEKATTFFNSINFTELVQKAVDKSVLANK